MKDLVIKGKRIINELIILASLFILSFIINITGIIIHDTAWIELLSQLHVVFILTLVLYILLWVVRLIINFVVWPFRKKRK
ncbi:MAG: hypothetical protein V2I34_00370 [Bacteroidales bacterium]|jgi:hypothetical protein|nr:hypothetical protein [Bacteroidales bacterium]